MAHFMELTTMVTAGLQLPPVTVMAPYFYGTAIVLTYQLLRRQKRKLIAFG